MDPKGVTTIIIGVTVALLLIGILLPMGFTAYHNDSRSYTTTLTTTGGITTIGQGISINLTAANASANATFALYELGALVDTQLVNLDATGTFAAPGGSVTVTPTAITTNSATIDMVIPTHFRWDTNEIAMFGMIGILVLVGLMLAFIAFAMKVFE
jgi:hypothetical protein